MTARKPIDVTVLLLEGGFASTAIGPLEVFHAAGNLWNRLLGETPQPRFRVRTASLDGRPIKSLCNLKLQAEFRIADIERTDIVILPASALDLQEKLISSTGLIAWLRKMHKRGAQVAGICSGVAYLAEAGLLDGREATTHWAVADDLRERYPKVCWNPDQFVTDEGHVLCSGGVYAAIDLSLHLVEKHCGREIALQTAKALLVNMPRASQRGYAVAAPARAHTDESIRKAEDYLRRHFREGPSNAVLARHVGMSERTLMRRFKAATGRLPGEYVQVLRMAAARELLERDVAPVAVVASKVGYEDLGFFRDVFKRHTGMTPAEYRGRFQGMAVAGD